MDERLPEGKNVGCSALLGEPGSPANLPYDMYCRYGACQAHEPHMPWCTEFTLHERVTAARPKVQSRCSGLSSGVARKCCERSGEYNGFASGPPEFVCQEHCPCHD